MLKLIIKVNLLLIIIIFSGYQKSYGQFYFQLSFKEFDIEYKPKKIPDTLVQNNVKKYPNKKLIIYITGEKGESHFELFSKQNHLIMKGEYANSIDTLSKYKFSKSLGFADGKSHYDVSILKYFQPLQNGAWYYYDEKQKLLRKDEYEFTHR